MQEDNIAYSVWYGCFPPCFSLLFTEFSFFAFILSRGR